MNNKLSGKVALVTGASKGLGRAMALALGGAGAQLILVSRDLKQLKESAEAVSSLGAKAEILQADVTEEAQVRPERTVEGYLG